MDTDDMNDCLQHVVDIADARRGKSRSGRNQVFVAAAAAFNRAHRGSCAARQHPEVAHEAATAAVRAHGLEAVSQALAVKLRG